MADHVDPRAEELIGRRTFLAQAVAGAVLATGASAETRQQRFDALVAQGWRAHGKDWLELERCFLAARALRVRELNEPELRAISFGRRMRGDLSGSLEVARYNCRLYPIQTSTEELAWALAATGDYQAARAAVLDWNNRGQPGDDPKTPANVWDPLLEAIGVRVEWFTITLGESTYPDDIRKWYRAVGGWDLPFPLPKTDSRYIVENVERTEERIDSAENRWLRLFPLDMDRPVKVTVLWKSVPAMVAMDSLLEAPYSVPPRYAAYLEKTDECDPQAPAVVALAAKLKGRSLAESVHNVWRWLDQVVYGGNSGDGVAITIAENRSTCRGQAEAGTALLRALGVAARNVRGCGHSWVEAWVPGAGWVELQQYVPYGKTGWILGFLAEPVDWTTHSPLLDWNICNDLYISQFSDFYVWHGGTEHHLLARGFSDPPLEKFMGDLVPAHGQMLQTKLW